jgi:acetyltransferase
MIDGLDMNIAKPELKATDMTGGVQPDPAALVSDVRLSDGQSVLLRPVHPEDGHLAADFFARLDPEDVRLRLFTPMKELSPAFVARMTEIDYANEMAFVALSNSGNLLGVARLIREADNNRAEFAVIVRSDVKGLGLGSELMQKLIGYARDQGIRVIEGHVLPENMTMLALCNDLGFSSTAHPDGHGLRLVSLQLP